MNASICLYFIEPLKDRWIKGDKHIVSFLKKLLRKKSHTRSLFKVFENLQSGLKKIAVPFTINKPFAKLQEADIPIVLGNGKAALNGYKKPNPIIAGIGLMTHPAQWPDLFEKYPVKFYLQHSEWTNDIYRKYYGNRCRIWPVGIDTDHWKPSGNIKNIDVLIYVKFLFDKRDNEKILLDPLISELQNRGLSFHIIDYGSYTPDQYKKLLNKSSCMLFLCEHESQGIAYQEAMSMNVPIIAWDQGFWLDPNRFAWGEKDPVPATSVPYFSDECGIRFKNKTEFTDKFDAFFTDVKDRKFSPRNYILKNLTLEKSAERMIEIISEIS